MLSRHKKGFTLTELLIVISILVFLALLVLALTRGQLSKGKDARRKGDMHKIIVAAEEYEKDNNCYPLSDLVVCKPGTLLLPYIEKIPCDPTTNTSYYYENEDSICPKWFRIYTKLENQNDPDIVSQGCVNGCGPQTAFNFYLGNNDALTPIQGSGPAPGGPGGGGAGSGASGSGGSGSGDPSEYYGCKSGACTPIIWNPARPGPECDPNFQNPTCYGFCTNPSYECQAWNQ